MDICYNTKKAYKADDLYRFLRGDGDYMVETSQFAPAPEITDVSKVLSKGIYKVYAEDKGILDELENNLRKMVKGSDYDLYIACTYIMSQLFKEKEGLSPFQINLSKIICELPAEIDKRKENIQIGIEYPSGYINTDAMRELERFNRVCLQEYGFRLF